MSMILDDCGGAGSAVRVSDGAAFRIPATATDCRNFRRGTGAFIGLRSFVIGSLSSRRQRLALGLDSKRQEKYADDEHESGQSHGSAEGLEVMNAGANQKSEAGGRKTPDVGDKRKGAGAAFGSVLFGQPKRIDFEIGPAHTEKKSADEEPGHGIGLHIENVTEGQPDR